MMTTTTPKTSETETPPVAPEADPRLAALRGQRAATVQLLEEAQAVAGEADANRAAVEAEWRAVGRAQADERRKQTELGGQRWVDEDGRETFTVAPPAAVGVEQQARRRVALAEGAYTAAYDAVGRALVRQTAAGQRVGGLLMTIRQLDTEIERVEAEAEAVARAAAAEAAAADADDGRGVLLRLRDQLAGLVPGGGRAAGDGPPAPTGVTVDAVFAKTYWLDATRTRVIEDGDPAAALLLGRAGCLSPIDEALLEWAEGRGCAVRRVRV